MIVFTLLALAAGAPDRTTAALESVSEGQETYRGVVGVRVGMTRGTGIEGEPVTSFLFAGRGEELRTRGLVSSHGAHSWAIGGGTGGFEGGLALAIAVGPRIPIHPDHGPFVRLGARGSLEGNRELYDSLLELPRAEVGWQYLHDWTAIEIGATYGALLTGRFRAGRSETRHMGNGFASGAYAVVQLPMMRLGARVDRLPTKDGPALESASVHGCAIGAPFALCIDARWMRGDLVVAGASAEATSVYGGVMLGIVPPQTGKDWSKANSWATAAGSSL
jgi:hypothetical protein